MLARLEGAYLNALRIFILIAATIALLVTCIAFVTSVPFFATQLGISSTPDPRGGDLSQFISEKKLTSTKSDPSEGATPETYRVSLDLQKAAALMTQYLNKHHKTGAKQADAEIFFSELQSELPYAYQEGYGASIRRLMTQLSVSKGKPLSEDQVGEMVQWHFQRFKADAAVKEGEAAASGAKAMAAMTVAGGAFLLFIFIVFCFLVVKIERNLRVVHTARVTEEA